MISCWTGWRCKHKIFKLCTITHMEWPLWSRNRIIWLQQMAPGGLFALHRLANDGFYCLLCHAHTHTYWKVIHHIYINTALSHNNPKYFHMFVLVFFCTSCCVTWALYSCHCIQRMIDDVANVQEHGYIHSISHGSQLQLCLN